MGAMRGTAVALYFHRLSGRGGGAERMVIALAGGLAERGWNANLVSWDDLQTDSFYPIPDGVAWHRLGAPLGFAGKFRRVAALRRALRAMDARALVGFVMSGDRTVMAAAKLAGCRLIAAERNGPALYRLRYGFFDRIAAFCGLFLADAVTVQFPRFIGGYPTALRRSIHAIANPVGTADGVADTARPNADGRFRILSVGRLDPLQKRPLLLLDAFARIAAQAPLWDLEFVGDGPDADRLQERIAATGLQDRIFVVPSTRKIADRYAAAHLFAMPSLWEGFPNALAEAMAARLPAIGFAHADGVSDLIGSDAGWLVSAGHDAVALSDALVAAMSDPEERARKADAGFRRIGAYTPERTFDEWSELLSSAIAGRP
jgi:GalNAc-alpha-(1->4)-GalNAc-alpha-(1->3)-diNAcBac-PP-undecaprenol alpha-1,4-N-acetyl-D-galactosaminyltransferase